MKTILLALFLSFNALANMIEIDSSKAITEKPFKTISGLKIVNCNSKKLGKHIYVVSDLYIKKRISIYNQNGQKVYSTITIGSPIYLSNFNKGNYTIKITEEGKTTTKELIVE